jgi:hypothetical protein
MGVIAAELATLAEHLKGRREAILLAWRRSIARDPALTTGDALPRVQLLDHIPAILATFERELYNCASPHDSAQSETGQANAAAHGLQRWQQRDSTHRRLSCRPAPRHPPRARKSVKGSACRS